MTKPSGTMRFAESVSERRVGPCRLLMLRTPVRDVVTWYGSIRSNPAFEQDEELVQDVTVALLDKGTKGMDRFAIAAMIEDRGAKLSFSSGGLRVRVSGRALRMDVPEMLGLTALQLSEPLFDGAEFEKTRARMEASIRRSMESTGAQAAGALRRRLYDRSHPNYEFDPDHRLHRLQDLSVEEIRAFHANHFGSNAFTLVVAGDLDEEIVADAVTSHFEEWDEHDAPTPQPITEVEANTPGRSVVAMPDKQNLDVRLGHRLPLRRGDVDYLPVFLANYVLGGNFSARLMQTIRDEMGLTYGIHSSLPGIGVDHAGHWQIAVTLSKEYQERGIEETLEQVRRFVEHGITAEELSEKKTTITGSFAVGLATTSGLAAALLTNAERGFDVAYLDRYPEEVHAVSLEQANAAIRKWLSPDGLHVTLAGSLAEEGTDGRSKPGGMHEEGS